MRKETLSSRQRVLKALNHEEPDRMPIDLGVHFSTGISAFAYWRLREYLGFSTDQIEMADCVQLLARVDLDIAERFHVDTVLLNPPWPRTHIWRPRPPFHFLVPETFRPEQQKDGAWVSKGLSSSKSDDFHTNEEKSFMPSGGFFFDGAWPDYFALSPEDKLEYFAKRGEQLRKETDKFTMHMGYGAFFGDLEFACDMLTDPEMCKERNAKALENQIQSFDRMNKRMGQFVDAIEVNSDLGTQNALMCTPDSYEEICYPYLKAFCEHVHNTSEIKIFMHSCGSIADALPFIVDAGVDAINPVQISARNMNPLMLKEKFGNKISFWGGGCDTQSILWQKTPEEVSRHVKETVETFKPGGGFVFNQVHNIMGNVPPENIVAMLDTAYENSFYE